MTPGLPEACNVTSILYTLTSHPRGPDFTPFRSTTSRFALRPAVFEIQAFRKSEMHPMTPE